MVNTTLSILNNGSILSALNEIFIVPIPKKKRSEKVQDFRTVSLCKVVYKIIVKMIANRLKIILPKVISPNQFVVVQERLITNNVLPTY